MVNEIITSAMCLKQLYCDGLTLHADEMEAAIRATVGKVMEKPAAKFVEAKRAGEAAVKKRKHDAAMSCTQFIGD